MRERGVVARRGRPPRSRPARRPISTTSASATGRAGSGAVTPKQQSVSAVRSAEVPEKVIAGCRASGMTCCASAGSRTPTPNRPEVCTDDLARLPAPVAAQPGDELGQRRRRGRSAAPARPRPRRRRRRRIGTPGSSVSARSREAALTADAATTRCPARASAAPRTAPTRPVPTTPTSSRAGRRDASYAESPALRSSRSVRCTGGTYPARRPPRPGDRPRLGGPDGCPPAAAASARAVVHKRAALPAIRSSTSLVHRCPHVINRRVHRPCRSRRKPLASQGNQPAADRPKHPGKTFGQPLARLLATRIEISHAARSGARKPEATSADAHQERRRTARRPTGHGGRGNPVAVADDDAATRTDRADAIAVRRTAAGLPEGIRSRTSCRAQREGVKAGAQRM